MYCVAENAEYDALVDAGRDGACPVSGAIVTSKNHHQQNNVAKNRCFCGAESAQHKRINVQTAR